MALGFYWVEPRGEAMRRVGGAGAGAEECAEKKEHVGGEHDAQRQITCWRVNKEIGFKFGSSRALLADRSFGGHDLFKL